VHAVRLVRLLAVLALVLFVAWASTYSNSSALVSYGRENGASWNLRKASQLDETALRAHEGERVVWLVGSSILREAFDEEAINQVLGDISSPYRARKFGQTRGASGLSSGMLEKLPIRAGDLVIHNVAVENFRRDWIDFTELPDWRILLLLDAARIWEIEEWSTAQKLELLVAHPQDFYRYHDESMLGWFRVFKAASRGKEPRVRKRSIHTRFKTIKRHRKLRKVRNKGQRSRNVIDFEALDLSETQFNMQGLQWLREDCDARGVELILVDVPQRSEYRSLYLGPGVWEAWEGWMDAQPELVHFPQPPDDYFYDMKHPNYDGRLMLSTHLVKWLNDRHRSEIGTVIKDQKPGASP
jgi:hypothetical protein